jgi:hypothetical protein
MVSTFDSTLFVVLAIMAIIIFLKYQDIGITSMSCGCRRGCRCRNCRYCKEGFGTSPGTLQQLAANHVPTERDIPTLRNWWAQTNAGIKQMTEFDQESNVPVANYAWPGFARVGAFA